MFGTVCDDIQVERRRRPDEEATVHARRLREELDRMCNDVFDTPELQRYFPRPLTWPAHRVKSTLMQRYFVPTNRDCWAYAMAAAPMDVKAIIWKHEEEELIHDPSLGGPHVPVEADRPDREHSFAEPPEGVEVPPGAVVALYARRQFAKDSSWLAGLASIHVIERTNDPTVIQGPALAQRGINQLLEDLHVPWEQVSAQSRVHVDADIEHSALTWRAFERYVRDEVTYAQAFHGATMGLSFLRTYAGAVGELMARVSR
jgi:hypothetical protein